MDYIVFSYLSGSKLICNFETHPIRFKGTFKQFWGRFWAKFVEIQLFPSSTNRMLKSFGIPLLIQGILSKVLENLWQFL